MTGAISPMRRWQYGLLLLSIVMLWPMVVNGGAFYFPDTTTYIRGLDAALNRAVGWRSVWTETASLPNAATFASASTSATPMDGKPVLLGRSVYYGVLPFTGMALGSLEWLTTVVQALTAGAACIGLVRHFVDPRRPAFGWACAACFALLAATSLPFFVSMLMPDFIAGVGILAAAVLIAGWRREGRIGRAFWFALVLAAGLMHSANVLISLAIACLPLAVAVMRRDGATMRGAALVVAGALLGLVGEAAFIQAVTRITGAPPIRPPYVAARLIEDGPGMAYLDRTCPASGFMLCRFRSRLPQASDTFLWSMSSSNGVFSASPPIVQRALAAEQGRFVASVVTTFPLDSTAAMLRAIGRQMSLLSLLEFNYPRQGHLERMPPAVMRDIVTTRAYARTMPVDLFGMILWPMTLASLAVIGVALVTPTMRRAASYGAIVLLGWFANDVLCGALSTPHDRYQTRIVWVLPLAALLILIRRYARSFEADARAGAVRGDDQACHAVRACSGAGAAMGG